MESLFNEFRNIKKMEVSDDLLSRIEEKIHDRKVNRFDNKKIAVAICGLVLCIGINIFLVSNNTKETQASMVKELIDLNQNNLYHE